MTRRTAAVIVGCVAIAIGLASPAAADPAPPAPPPDAPRCLTMGGQPFPHLQYLPCGWDFDGVNWVQTAPPPPPA